ncbi:MAG: PDZ domain-containing protein [Planctomycetaceae bacterium]|nr:PDZ domain-containing protein [Planctomycetaceae bacterium]
MLVNKTFWLAATLVLCSLADAQTRDEIVRGDRKKVEAEGFWMYNDIPGAFRRAEQTGRPIVVVLRCLPCHECVKLDDELVDTHPVIRPLLEKFVCVRQVATNGLDLNLFQYDTDQSFAVFFLNADRTIYGRFGTRSHRTEWVGDVSLQGLAKALQAALDLHENYDAVKSSLMKKTGPPMEVASPEKYPALRDKFTSRLNYQGDVVKSCIHCHQIGDAQREYYWTAGKPIPEKVLFPYPHPSVVGLTLDPHELASVKQVEPGSAAARAGIEAGDQIVTFDGQPMLSVADVQWVLHSLKPDGGVASLTVKRDGREVPLTLRVSKGWRKAGDLSWRVTSWGLRRIAAGGMVLEEAESSRRRALKIPADQMALHVKRVGKYGPHGTAKRAGLREGDVIVSYNDQQNLMTEQQLHTYVVTQGTPGTKAEVVVYRGRRRMTFQLPMQK